MYFQFRVIYMIIKPVLGAALCVEHISGFAVLSLGWYQSRSPRPREAKQIREWTATTTRTLKTEMKRQMVICVSFHQKPGSAGLTPRMEATSFSGIILPRSAIP
jgi:hypothetical protein